MYDREFYRPENGKSKEQEENNSAYIIVGGSHWSCY